MQVYTGNGKGKTTAALGLAIRAVGADFKVYIGQFIKDFDYSEILALKTFENHIYIEQYGQGHGFVHSSTDKTNHIAAAREGLQLAEKALKSGLYDMIILDEINVALSLDLLEVSDVMNLIEQKPESTELILTGRNAHEEILKRADLVTEMKEVKHYYNNGVMSRLGIEK